MNKVKEVSRKDLIKEVIEYEKESLRKNGGSYLDYKTKVDKAVVDKIISLLITKGVISR